MLRRRRFRFAILALLPTFAIFAWVRIWPILQTMNLSVRDWDLIGTNRPFIGLANFMELFGDTLFRTALINTAIIAFGVMLLTIPAAIVLAALIHYRTRSRFSGFYEPPSSSRTWSRWFRRPWRGNGSSMPNSAR
jgi:multiple sugar transport system permease protein